MRKFFNLLVFLIVGTASVFILNNLSSIFIDVMRLSAASEYPGDITLEGLLLYLIIISVLLGSVLSFLSKKLPLNINNKSDKNIKLLILPTLFGLILFIFQFIQYYKEMMSLPRILF
ncbi:hypothetical protein [Halalkalibacter nanhaiisediminis]|uniref:Uncharacterized protein n=1 Tax=Halalkalibacter nanhaiisediminis TaxID=688079 RepID=A0A562QM21_9BACI|nr:hypothetical protein [Halalkalibacter nanhaiisediminis]TWI57801.1 hypothetical protein IQ10_01129 [Halalkalibacter nanhaiisediminis]